MGDRKGGKRDTWRCLAAHLLDFGVDIHWVKAGGPCFKSSSNSSVFLTDFQEPPDGHEYLDGVLEYVGSGSPDTTAFAEMSISQKKEVEPDARIRDRYIKRKAPQIISLATREAGPEMPETQADFRQEHGKRYCINGTLALLVRAGYQEIPVRFRASSVEVMVSTVVTREIQQKTLANAWGFIRNYLLRTYITSGRNNINCGSYLWHAEDLFCADSEARPPPHQGKEVENPDRDPSYPGQAGRMRGR
ncbi:hypothetical protein K438DRAFT_1749729 [Mycena galopus ATCC 62051]|nr:hypothetical protein K438DRAFT_1749729 [Mycena galopus ATCC 62051]